MDGRANPLMDRKVVGPVFFGVVAIVAMVAVWCSAVVVVVAASWSCQYSVVQLV